MKLSKTLFAGIAIAVGASLAAPPGADAQEEIVEYRQSLMQAFRMHMGGVGAATSGTAPMGHAVYHADAFHGMAQALSLIHI